MTLSFYSTDEFVSLIYPRMCGANLAALIPLWTGCLV